MKIIDKDLKQPKINPDARKIIFRHGKAPGDNVMFTAGIRDFCLLFPDIVVGVDKRYPWIWENNPYIDHNLSRGEDVEYYNVGYPAVNYTTHGYTHFSQMFLLDMIAVADHYNRLPITVGEFCSAFANGTISHLKDAGAQAPYADNYAGFCKNFSRQRGDLHLSEEEIATNLVLDMYGIENYWVVATGGKSDYTAKMWDWRRFQKVIDYYDGLITFVTIGTVTAQTFLEDLRGVLDLTEKFNGQKIRGLVPLVYHAEGVVSTPSLLMHLGAAVPMRDGKAKAGVTIFGGREPTTWSWYCNYQILHTNGVFSCCSAGGCWKSRTYPLSKDSKHNKSLCKQPLEVSGRTIQACMDTITSDDVIRAVGRYYEGDLYNFDRAGRVDHASDGQSEDLGSIPLTRSTSSKEINVIGNLNSKGGGEQSLCKIAQVLAEDGWKVHLYPASNGVHDNYKNLGLDINPDHSLEVGAIENVMVPGIPLLFYANDTTRLFSDVAQEIVEKSSDVVIGINYVNRPLPYCEWLAKSGKLRGVIFQNQEKKEEWDSDEIGYTALKKPILYGAIDLDAFLEVNPPSREKDDPAVILKHCVADPRKYVTKESVGKGEKRHLWQKHFSKELDTKFYSRMLKKFGNKVRFEFMEAPRELVEYFKDEPRMVFHKWNAMPVTEFLARGHIYLYRTSDRWRDNFPRTVAEALAAGLPVLTEPRDGPLDRVKYGDTGFHCVDFDQYCDGIAKFLRKEKMRAEMGQNCKNWARFNLNPRKWAKIIGDLVL